MTRSGGSSRARLVVLVGCLLVVVPTGLGAYLRVPMPGSQDLDSIRLAWWLARIAPWAAAVGVALLAVGLVAVARAPGRRWRKALWAVPALVAAWVLWLAHAAMAPARWFRPAETVVFATGTSDALPPETLVMGVAAGGEAKAYPVRLLAYHHRLPDTLGGEPILVTYCSMCRTGKVFRPEAEGRPLTFDLVGAFHYNSVYADRETGSWWWQANGVAAVGPLAGARLPELLVDQTTLGEWLALHPESAVLQPDPAFAEGYGSYGFDEWDTTREREDAAPAWQWVVGVVHDGEARGYPWSVLARDRLLEDALGDLPLALHLRADGFSHRVWDRRVDGRVLDLALDPAADVLVDPVSGSRFGFDGVARGGGLDGRRLRQVPATLEFRHSFERFSGGRPWTPPEGATMTAP